jgi:HPt (histidine-containing phosphotransfer) domain-containing protein
MVPDGSANDEGAMLERIRSDGPAEAASDQGSPPECDRGPPLDLIHLARQCEGDRELEDELLGLFRLQSRALAAQVSEALPASLESMAKSAHKLCGSALAIGAWRVAGAARGIEEGALAVHGRGPPSPKENAALARAIAALEASVDEAVAEIERILG